ncbi:NACHT domain-containing protein [Streptomyces tubercidicus]|uniref:NACHT domain-containing protein n=1 Tax=Streptomyces tubercidicus TaxID=47759 RepID=UPI0037AFE784
MGKRVLRWVSGLLAGAALIGLGMYFREVGLEDADQTASVIGAFVGLGGLALAAYSIVLARRGNSPPVQLQDLADALAHAVRGQWEAEVQVRRLNDPYPLPVAWTNADPRLMEPWPLLEELARSWPGGPPGATADWAATPAGLSGQGGEIDQVFSRRVPTRRLLVLGEPGVGKTVLLIRLLLSLLEHRSVGGPVPVIFSLASWDPMRQDLYTWMADQLARDHAGLRAPSAVVNGHLDGRTQARALLEHRLIMPILDGLDELPKALRAQALDAINQALPLRQPLVLSSRAAEYRDALNPVTGITTRLAGAAGIRLLPLEPAQAAAYLQRDAGGTGTPAAMRWDAILTHLHSSEAPVAQALSTPLMLFMARIVYNPRPGENSATLPDPTELCDVQRFPNRSAVETHLFDAFIPAAYRPHPLYPCKWKPQQAEEAFAYLARHLQHNLQGTVDLAWWQLHRILPLWILQIVCGVMAGIADWLAGGAIASLGSAIPANSSVADYTNFFEIWAYAAPGGLVGGLAGGLTGKLRGGLVGGLLGGLGLWFSNGFWFGDFSEIGRYLVAGIAYGFVGGLVGELVDRPTARRTVAEALAQAMQSWHWSWAAVGFTVGTAYALVQEEEFWPVGLIAACAYGLAGGLVGVRGPRQEAAPASHLQLAWDRRVLAVALSGLLLGASLWLQVTFEGGWPEVFGGYGDLSTSRVSTPFAYGLAGAIAYGLRAAPVNLAAAVSPAKILKMDRRTFWSLCTAVMLCVTCITGFAMLCEPQLTHMDEAGDHLVWGTDSSTFADALLIAPELGLAAGVAVALNRTAMGFFILTRGYATLRRRLPRNLMGFLSDAHERRGVLRQAGAAYQFRHLGLQRRLTEHS